MNAFVKARYGIIIDYLKTYGLDRHHTLLDIGCGDGALLGEIFLRFSPKIVGIDTSVEGIEFAKEMFKQRKYSGKFLLNGGYASPFDNESFDFCICSDVIEHVREPVRLLEETQRILKKNGIFIITTPIKTTEEPLDKMHVYEWYPNEFKELCASVFGEPTIQVLSHPTIWYELYTNRTTIQGRFIGRLINIITKFGKNPFYNNSITNNWRLFTLQTIVFKKQ